MATVIAEPIAHELESRIEDWLDEKPTLVIGDVHGHFDRLEALLKQERIIGYCPDCGGFGDQQVAVDELDFCSACGGDGERRVNYDVTVIQLGDLGHQGDDGSPGGDTLCWQYADRWFDLVLWGNHDRAVFDPRHEFAGYRHPGSVQLHLMHALENAGKLKFAAAAHGFLITHAGLHAAFKLNECGDLDKNDPYAVAEWINTSKDADPLTGGPADGIVDAISHKRGGGAHAGGILWRDFTEKLWRGFPQVFGHSTSRKREVREDGDSWCIDIGGRGDKPGDNCLAGIWLPGQRVVQVDL